MRKRHPSPGQRAEAPPPNCAQSPNATWKGQCEEAHGGIKAWGLWHLGDRWQMELEGHVGLTRRQKALVGRARCPAGEKPLEVTTGFCTRSDIQSGHRNPPSFLSKTIHPEEGGNFHVGRYGGGFPSSDSCSPKLFSSLDFCHHFCHHWWVFLLMAQPSGVAIFVHQMLW